MPAGAAKGERRGGRVKGSLPKKVIEANLLAKQVVARATGKPVRKLAVEVLEEFMQLYAGYAAFYQPTPNPNMKQNSNADPKKFQEYSALAVYVGKALANYQSPRMMMHHVSGNNTPQMGGSGAPAAPGGLVIEGQVIQPDNVVSINDPDALARVYRNLIGATRRA